MNKVFQVGMDGCHAACVATILGVTLESMPKCFYGHTWDWVEQCNFLSQFGYQPIEIPISGFNPVTWPWGTYYAIAMVDSNNLEGKHHSVLYHAHEGDCRMVHDPKPGQWNLNEPKTFTFLVKFDSLER